MKRDDINSLAHSKWDCKYHIVFAPKYRRMVIYSQIKTDIGKILRRLCEQKGVEIIEAEACPDHIHTVLPTSPMILTMLSCLFPILMLILEIPASATSG